MAQRMNMQQRRDIEKKSQEDDTQKRLRTDDVFVNKMKKSKSI